MARVTWTTPRAAAALFASLLALPGCKKEDLEGAKAEVQDTSIKLDLPPVPEFAMPQSNPDGTHGVAEMRLKGNKFLDTDVQVKGYVVWIYDCATAIRTPDMTEPQLKKLMVDEPERCSRPNFVIGDEANTPADKGIWVVEVPRAPREDEKKGLPKEVVADMDAQFKALPAFQVGDQIQIAGKWALVSPKGFRNSDGLLVYTSMQNLTTPAVPGAPGAPAAPGKPAKK